jgi:hypothetical protein
MSSDDFQDELEEHPEGKVAKLARKALRKKAAKLSRRKRVFKGWKIVPEVDYEDFTIRWKAKKEGQSNIEEETIGYLRDTIKDAEGDLAAKRKRLERIHQTRRLFKALDAKYQEYLGWTIRPHMSDDQTEITWYATRRGEKQINGDTFAHVKMHIMRHEDEPAWRQFLEKLV